MKQNKKKKKHKKKKMTSSFKFRKKDYNKKNGDGRWFLYWIATKYTYVYIHILYSGNAI